VREAVLWVAAGGSLAMALYHFFLPSLWGWTSYLERVPVTVSWGVLSINAFFSTLLLLLAALTVAVAVDRQPPGAPSFAILAAAAVFWAVNAAYQLAIPMPLPAAMAALRWVLLGFAGAMLALYVAALVTTVRAPA
jgi:hypothetical protein